MIIQRRKDANRMLCDSVNVSFSIVIANKCIIKAPLTYFKL